MSRYIDADALEGKAKQYSLGYYEADEWAVPLCEISEAPSIDIVRCGEWIPCSERLPEEDGLYLATVTDDGERFETAKMVYVGSEWIDTGFWEYEVIAWMPLPKPYGEREGE